VNVVVTVGSSVIPFDRLIEAAGELADRHEVVVQSGASTVRPPGITCIDFFSFDDLAAHVRAADAVVMHAGVGSAMLALANGKRPILVPRDPVRGEAVDDHQLVFARRLAAAGLVGVLEDVADLDAAVAAVDDSDRGLRPGLLANDLKGYVAASVARSRRPSLLRR
jgi:UDP-N-acetylglucosamine transferase subunit ALG13